MPLARVAIAGAENLTEAGAAPRLTANQWKVVRLCALAGMLETLDMYVIAYVLAFITGPWNMSYGQSATILLASGVGGLLGSVAWGHVADRFGRKAAFSATIFTCSVASLALAFTPTGDWIYLAAWRTVVGFGAGGFFLFVVLVQEFAPAGRRGFASGIVSTAAAGGLLLGALVGSFLVPWIGWRGMFAIGALPVFLGVVVLYAIPESPRWLMIHGRGEAARRSLQWSLGAGVDASAVAAADALSRPAADALADMPATARTLPRWRDVFGYPRSVAAGTMINLGALTGYYGMVLWAPTLLAQIQGIPAAQAARMMIGLSLAGLLSRLAMGWLADRHGRRRCGGWASIGAAFLLVTAGLVGHGVWLTPALFWLPFALAFVCADSGFSVMGLYTSEIWPSRLRGRGSGLSYAAGGIGKIIGPLGLALLIGSSNLIKPAATVSAIVPAFVYLASMFALAGCAYLFIARETCGETLERIEAQLR